jgi:1L-myo-inositol 1-phosphate cytidylyltransferase
MIHSPNSSEIVRQAIVLAAGNGDRFRNGISQSKLLTPVGGTPLLIRTLTSAQRAGISDAHIVLGYDAARVRALAESAAPAGLHLHFHLNRDWHRENGVSVLAARASVRDRPFALMMGDHIFESQVLERLLRWPRAEDEALLGIDRQTHLRDDALSEIQTLEATKVQLRGDRVTAIGKSLHPFDALDTGLFVCDASVFDALAAACAGGDSTLSGGIGRLAPRGLVRGVDIGAANWCDIDTIDDLAVAERLVSCHSHA